MKFTPEIVIPTAPPWSASPDWFIGGRPLTEHDYFGTLAGLSEETIIGTWLGVDGPELARLVEERIERYLVRSGLAYTAARGDTIRAMSSSTPASGGSPARAKAPRVASGGT